MISTWCMNCDGVEPGQRRWVAGTWPAATVADNRRYIAEQLVPRLERLYGPVAAVAFHVEAHEDTEQHPVEYKRVVAVKVY